MGEQKNFKGRKLATRPRDWPKEAEKEGEKGSKGDVACYWGEQPPEASEVSMSRGPRPVDNTYRQVSERRDSALVGLRARTWGKKLPEHFFFFFCRGGGKRAGHVCIYSAEGKLCPFSLHLLIPITIRCLDSKSRKDYAADKSRGINHWLTSKKFFWPHSLPPRQGT